MLTALVLGFYFSRRFDIAKEDGKSFATLDHAQIWQDIVWFFGMVGFICGKTAEFGNGARTYFDAEIQPWLSRHNVNVSLPSFDLPRLPGKRSETVVQ